MSVSVCLSNWGMGGRNGTLVDMFLPRLLIIHSFLNWAASPLPCPTWLLSFLCLSPVGLAASLVGGVFCRPLWVWTVLRGEGAWGLFDEAAWQGECWGSGPIPDIAFPFLPTLMLYSKMLISSGFPGVRSKIMLSDPTHLSVLKVLLALMVARAGAGMCIRKYL